MVKHTKTGASQANRSPGNPHSEGFRRTGSIATLLLITFAVMTLLGFGGWWIYNQSGGTAVVFDPITAQVGQGDFIAQVLDQGEIQSSENIEVRCRARARNGELKVIEVVPEGTRVKPGDFLVRLDQTGFETELEQQKIQVATAETSQIQSKATLDAAIASKKEYIEGIYVESFKTIENEKFDAEASKLQAQQELDQSLAVRDHSRRLQSKGFLNAQQVRADEFAVERAKTNLEKALNSIELAEKKLEVLEKITREKEMVRLDSEIASAEVKYKNDQEALRVEKQKLDEIVQQIANCLIVVPDGVEGQVVYAKESSRSGTEWVLEEGTTVRENQVLLRLPNPSKMEVKALINEQSITQIRAGMPASIRVDALNNQTLKGTVTKVSQYAEQSNWFSSSSVRKYAVLVKITDPPEALKPGMNASVSIQTRYEKSVLTMPIQCVYGVEDRYFCLARTKDQEWETREIKSGGDNSQVVLIREGLAEGDEVVMNPGAYKDRMDLPEVKGDEPLEAEAGSVPTDGSATPAAAGEAAAPAAGTAPGAGAAGAPAAEGPGRSAGGGGGFDIAAMINEQVKAADTNGNDKIEAAELEAMEERSREMLKRADSNSDGEVSRSEIDATVKRIAERMRSGGGPGGAGGGPGGPGGGAGGGTDGGRGRGPRGGAGGPS